MEVLLKHLCVMVDKDSAPGVLTSLLAQRRVEQKLRIKSMGSAIAIPISDSGKDGETLSVEEFEPRFMMEAPQSVIRRELGRIGIPYAGMPERWVRLGRSLILRLPDLEQDALRKVAGIYARAIGTDSVYRQTGWITGPYREPRNELLYGPGGEITHLENGIRYIMDPAKVMFSPGNVNIRTAMRDLDLSGCKVMDMFAGIGYFSLGIGKYTKADVVYSCEINPASYHYLERNVKKNHLAGRVVPILGDSRFSLPTVKADAVVMGNFMAYDYLPHALWRLADGGLLILHDLVSTEELGRYAATLAGKGMVYGRSISVEKVRTVKSYSPHMWHIMVMARVMKRHCQVTGESQFQEPAL